MHSFGRLANGNCSASVYVASVQRPTTGVFFHAIISASIVGKDAIVAEAWSICKERAVAWIDAEDEVAGVEAASLTSHRIATPAEVADSLDSLLVSDRVRRCKGVAAPLRRCADGSRVLGSVGEQLLHDTDAAT
jgi:hypothetical protein